MSILLLISNYLQNKGTKKAITNYTSIQVHQTMRILYSGGQSYRFARWSNFAIFTCFTLTNKSKVNWKSGSGSSVKTCIGLTDRTMEHCGSLFLGGIEGYSQVSLDCLQVQQALGDPAPLLVQVIPGRKKQKIVQE